MELFCEHKSQHGLVGDCHNHLHKILLSEKESMWKSELHPRRCVQSPPRALPWALLPGGSRSRGPMVPFLGSCWAASPSHSALLPASHPNPPHSCVTVIQNHPCPCPPGAKPEHSVGKPFSSVPTLLPVTAALPARHPRPISPKASWGFPSPFFPSALPSPHTGPVTALRGAVQKGRD